jgi:hypothetical protein
MEAKGSSFTEDSIPSVNEKITPRKAAPRHVGTFTDGVIGSREFVNKALAGAER